MVSSLSLFAKFKRKVRKYFLRSLCLPNAKARKALRTLRLNLQSISRQNLKHETKQTKFVILADKTKTQ